MSDKLAAVKFEIFASPPAGGVAVVLFIDEVLVFDPDPPNVAEYKSSMKPPRLPGRVKKTKARYVRRDFSAIEASRTIVNHNSDGSEFLKYELSYMLEKLIGDPVDSLESRIINIARSILRVAQAESWE